MQELLDILRRGSVGAYKRFFLCLRETNQSHVIEIIKRGGGEFDCFSVLTKDAIHRHRASISVVAPLVIMPPPYDRGALCDTAIRQRVHPSVCPMALLPVGYRHASFLQLGHRRPPEMCGLRTLPRTDVDPPRFLPPSNCHRRGASSRRPRGDTLCCRSLSLHTVESQHQTYSTLC